jgi:hypothetical protein
VHPNNHHDIHHHRVETLTLNRIDRLRRAKGELGGVVNKLGAATSVVAGLQSQLSEERLTNTAFGDRLQTFTGLAKGLRLEAGVVQAIERAEPRTNVKGGLYLGNGTKKRNRNAEGIKACLTPILNQLAKVD